MAKLVTLGDLRTRALERADMVNTQFRGTASINSKINKSCSKLYDLLVGAYGNYFVSTATLTPTSGVASLPSDFYKLLGVDEVLGGGQNVTCEPFELSERNLYVTLTNGRTFSLLYVPTRPDLVNDVDTFDSVNDWDEYVVLDVAIKLMGEEESDTSDLKFERKELKDELVAMAENRDAGMPGRWTDVHCRDPWIRIPSTRARYQLRGNTLVFVESNQLLGYP